MNKIDWLFTFIVIGGAIYGFFACYQLGYQRGHMQGFIKGMDKDKEIRKEVFGE